MNEQEPSEHTSSIGNEAFQAIGDEIIAMSEALPLL